MQTTYDIYDRTEPSKIYLAKPGKRLLGVLNGVEQDTCTLDVNLNNTAVLQFTLDRIVDGEVSNFYDLISQHYELYVSNFGWFKINEEPTLNNDGNVETMDIRAESLEIELQQYDLTGFRINTGAVDSWEMMAKDNQYRVKGTDSYLPRDNVHFYRDTTDIENALAEMDENSTEADLIRLIGQYPGLMNSWRITEEDGTIKIDYSYEEQTYDTVIGEYSYTTTTLSPYQVVEYELEREKHTSLLWLALNEFGWTVGYVDPLVTLDMPTPLADDRGMFDVDSQDVYSFLTQEVAEYFRCIFTFDTDNYRVNAYRIENLGWDTNIFLSFHNIQNSVTRSGDRPLYTVYNVSNEDTLDLKDVNFGSHEIEDVSYFLTTDHFSQEFLDKYHEWEEFREEQRTIYREKSLAYRKKMAELYDLYNRVPSGGIDTDQWDEMGRDQLLEAQSQYEALVRGYESYFEDENGEEGYEYSDGTRILIDMQALKESIYWDDYNITTTVILPNIQTALDNLDTEITETDQELEEYYDIYANGYILDDGQLGHCGHSYGIVELNNYIEVCQNNVDTLKEKGFDVDDQEDPYHHSQYLLYVKYSRALTDAQTTLAKRQGEYDTAKAEMEQIKQDMDELAESVDKKKYVGSEHGAFTEDELELLNKYYIHTDYINENIITTDISTDEEIIEQDEALYQDALEQLYADSHPQYVFQTTQDNLLLIPELNDWVNVTFGRPAGWVYNNYRNWDQGLWVGNFIRVSIRDDYQVKLRVTTISFNPFMIDPEIGLTFSNMVQYKSKRNDYVSLLGLNSGSSKNAATANYAAVAGTAETINVDTSLILKLIGNRTFKDYVKSSGGGEATSISPSATLNVSQIVGDQASFNRMFTQYLQANTIATSLLNASQANIDALSAQYVTADSVVASLVNAQEGDFDELTAGSAFIDYLESNLVVASEIKVNDLKAALAQVDTLEANSAFVNYLHGQTSTVIQSNATQAYIMNLVAANMSVADLQAGDITLSNNMRIVSDNGNLIMNGSALQILGEDEHGDPYVGVQLGYDTNQNPSLILRNSDGATVLTPQGITSDAIADELIVNSMVADGTLQESKMGFNVATANADGTISITNVKDGSGGNFGVEYTTFKQNTEDAIESSSYQLYIEAPNGKNVRGTNITLNAVLLRAGVDVTNDWDASYFIWERKSKDTYGDTYWNNAHLSGAKSITITANDVNTEADFVCRFEANGITVVSGGE